MLNLNRRLTQIVEKKNIILDEEEATTSPFGSRSHDVYTN